MKTQDIQESNRKKYPFMGFRPPHRLKGRIKRVAGKSRRSESWIVIECINRQLPALEAACGITNQ